MRRTLRGAAAAALVALVCTPAALADSIAYVKDGKPGTATLTVRLKRRHPDRLRDHHRPPPNLKGPGTFI